MGWQAFKGEQVVPGATGNVKAGRLPALETGKVLKCHMPVQAPYTGTGMVVLLPRKSWQAGGEPQ